MASITLTYVESTATEYIPHTEELFSKYQEVLTKFPDIEDDCSIAYYEPEEGEDQPGIHVFWANETPSAFSDNDIYHSSPLDLGEGATLEELQALHELIGDFQWFVSGSSSHGDDFETNVSASGGQVTWDGEWDA